jgi:hypothetical protein
MTPRLLGRSAEERTRRRLDIGGAALITAAIAAVVFAVSQGGAVGWTSPAVLGAAALAGLAAVAFAVVESRHGDPLIRGHVILLLGL